MSITAQNPISNLVELNFLSTYWVENEVINSINSSLIFLPYNSCGGGCISTNGRCCGTCASGDYRTSLGCPNNYVCSKVFGLDGSTRFECWHFGGIANGGKGFGVDVDSATLFNCSYFKILKQVNSNPLVLLTDNITYNNETTVAGWDEVIDVSYTTLKYYFEFYANSGTLINTILFQE